MGSDMYLVCLITDRMFKSLNQNNVMSWIGNLIVQILDSVYGISLGVPYKNANLPLPGCAGGTKQPKAFSTYHLLFHGQQGAEHSSSVLQLIDHCGFVSFYLKTVCKNCCLDECTIHSYG